MNSSELKVCTWRKISSLSIRLLPIAKQVACFRKLATGRASAGASGVGSCGRCDPDECAYVAWGDGEPDCIAAAIVAWVFCAWGSAAAAVSEELVAGGDDSRVVAIVEAGISVGR